MVHTCTQHPGPSTAHHSRSNKKLFRRCVSWNLFMIFSPHYCYYYWDRVPERVFSFIVNYYTFHVCVSVVVCAFGECALVVFCQLPLLRRTRHSICDSDKYLVVMIYELVSLLPLAKLGKQFNGGSMASVAFIDNHRTRNHIRSFVYYYFYFVHSSPIHAFNETKPRRRNIRKFVNFL